MSEKLQKTGNLIRIFCLLPSLKEFWNFNSLRKLWIMLTSRDRPKSAPHPRLKNSKRTSKCQFTVLENRKTKKTWRTKRGTLPKFSTFLSQLKGGPVGEKTNFRKSLTRPKNWKGGPFGIFKHPICCKISNKLKGGPFGKKNRKVSQCRKTERGDPLGFSNIHSVAKHQKIEGDP